MCSQGKGGKPAAVAALEKKESWMGSNYTLYSSLLLLFLHRSNPTYERTLL